MRTARLLGAIFILAASITHTASAEIRLTTLYSVIGESPVGLAASHDALYVASDAFGTGPGQIFELSPPSLPGGPWTETVLHGFGGPGDGSEPELAPVDVAGALYGTTSAGGAYFVGVFYQLQPPTLPGSSWVETVLYDFGAPGSDIGYAVSGLVKGPGGSFYVLTSAPNLCQLLPPTSPGGAWTATILYSFPNDVLPNSLVAGPNGVLYGTNDNGGTSAPDGVFQLTPPATPGGAWTETVIHSFFTRGGGPLNNPTSLTVAPDGTIYGTAYGYTFITGFGASGIFQLTPPAAPGGQWTYTNPTAPAFDRRFVTPVALVNGNLYGGISNGTGGSIFELQPPTAPDGAWTMTTLHVFTNGQVPTGNLVVEPDGVVYGTTAAAPGQPAGGTVFAILME